MLDSFFDWVKDAFSTVGKWLMYGALALGGVKVIESLSGKDFGTSGLWEGIKKMFGGSERPASSPTNPADDNDVGENERVINNLGIKDDSKAMEAWSKYQDKNKTDKVVHKIPLPHTDVKVTSGKGDRDLGRGARHHDGVDLVVNGVKNPDILASSGGVVLRKGVINGYGNIVVLGHADGSTSVYAHLESIAAIEVGQELKQGAKLGVMGGSGAKGGKLIQNAYPIHLHYEQRRGLDTTIEPVLPELGDLSREAVNGGVRSTNPDGKRVRVQASSLASSDVPPPPPTPRVTASAGNARTG